MCQKDWEEGGYKQGECWMLTVGTEVQGRLFREQTWVEEGKGREKA